jgi:hypothetical protein
MAHPYRLGKWLHSTAGSSMYWTEYGEDSQPAVIKLVEPDEAGGSGQLAMWRAAAQLSHPRLVRLLDAGRCEVGDVGLLYVVMERPEGNLANVLPERPLTAEEAGEMLEASVDALSYLHERGLAHGAVEPANIVAIGDQIKLSSDCIRQGDAEAAAADVWALGVTVIHALTQNAEAAIPVNLPQPFLDVARNSLRREPESRWTISDIRARLRGPQTEEAAAGQSRSRLYAIGAAVFSLIVILLLMARERREPIAVVQPKTPTVSAPLKQEPPTTVAEPPQPEPTGNWAVVAAAYAQRKDAEKRVQWIIRRWPRFKAEVRGSTGQKPYYLVILGANLSDKAAAALRQRARSAGVARDAYVTRFSQH